MNFSKRLKEIRINNNMTQKNVYTKINISPNGYASWEQGRTEPSIDNIKLLSLIFNVSSDYLLGLSDDEYISYQDNISTEEKKLLQKYRQLDDWSKEKLEIIINTFLEDNQDQAEINKKIM